MKTIELPHVRIVLECDSIPETVPSHYFFAKDGTPEVVDIDEEAWYDFTYNLATDNSSGEEDLALVQIYNQKIHCYPSRFMVRDMNDLIAELGHQEVKDGAVADKINLVENIDNNNIYWRQSSVEKALKNLLKEQQRKKEAAKLHTIEFKFPSVKIVLDCTGIPEELALWSPHDYIMWQFSGNDKIKTASDIISAARANFLHNLAWGYPGHDSGISCVTIKDNRIYCYPSRDLIGTWNRLCNELGYEDEENMSVLLAKLDKDDSYWKQSGVEDALKQVLEEQDEK